MDQCLLRVARALNVEYLEYSRRERESYGPTSHSENIAALFTIRGIVKRIAQEFDLTTLEFSEFIGLVMLEEGHEQRNSEVA